MPTWTTPTTNRSSTYTPTATAYAEVVNNLKFLQYQGAKGQTLGLHTSTTPSGYDPVTCGSGSWVTLPIKAVADATWDTVGALSATTGGSNVFTVPAGMAGVWNFDYWVAWEQWVPGFVNTHWYGVELVGGGTTMVLKWYHPYINGANPLVDSGSWAFYLTTGQTVTLKARQDSGANKFAVGWLHGQWLSGGSGTRPAFSKMTVPSPRSTVTAAIWNQLQGNLKFLHDAPWCWVRLFTAVAHTTSTYEMLEFDDTDVYDASGMHNPASNASRVTVPYSGVYLCNLAVSWDATPDYDANRGIVVERWTDRGDGTFVQYGDTRYDQFYVHMGSMCPLSATLGSNLSGTALVHCKAGDYLTFSAFQNSGATEYITAAEAQVIYLGQLRNVAYGDNLEAPPESGFVS